MPQLLLTVAVACHAATSPSPTGGFIKAIKSIWSFVSWLLDKDNQGKLLAFYEKIKEAVISVLQGGDAETVTTAVIEGLKLVVGPIIDLLAKLLGLGSIPRKVKAALGKPRMALHDLIVKVAKKFLGAIKQSLDDLLKKLGLDGEAPIGTVESFNEEGKHYRLWVTEDGTVYLASSPKKNLLKALKEAEGTSQGATKACVKKVLTLTEDLSKKSKEVKSAVSAKPNAKQAKALVKLLLQLGELKAKDAAELKKCVKALLSIVAPLGCLFDDSKGSHATYPGPYADLEGSDNIEVRRGRNFQEGQRAKILARNIAMHGALMSDDSKDTIKRLTKPVGSQHQPNTAIVDHIKQSGVKGPDGQFGSNSYCNAQVISHQYNNQLNKRNGK